jgi:hypothetical protein
VTRALRSACSLLFSLGCGKAPETPVVNACVSDLDCAAELSCDGERGLCVRARAEVPYTVVLQVTRGRGEPSALSRHTFKAFELIESRSDLDLALPSGASVRGFVRGPDSAPVLAQLAFLPVPESVGYPTSPLVYETSNRGNAGQDNLSAVLAPGQRYDVRILPLGPDSARYPPVQRSMDVGGDEGRFEHVYAELEAFRGILIDATATPQVARRLRLIDALSGQVLSSTARTDGSGGFELHAQPGSFDAESPHAFEVSLDADAPFQTVIRIPATRVDRENDNALRMPLVPGLVEFRGRVEESPDVRLSGTELIFRSSFALPTVTGDVRDRNWCRSRIPGDLPTPFTCLATVRANTDSEGRFSALLLPGDYYVFVSPGGNRDNVNRATTNRAVAVIETQTGGGPQQGQGYTLVTGARYRGPVRTSDGLAVKNVLVRASALGVNGVLGEVAGFNRSSESITDDNGRFLLPVDIGYYDISARPSFASGFPWVYVPNLAVQVTDTDLDDAGFDLPAPLVIAGRITRDGQAVASATLDAYALVKDLSGGKRAVPIGQTLTDEAGHYTLLLAPRILNGEDEP